MPGFVIHLAAANVFLSNNRDLSDRDAFCRGVIAPDLLRPKTRSHYSDDTATPGLDLYADSHDMGNDYCRGYYFHLLTDYLFYNLFLNDFTWSPAVYEDYSRMNGPLIARYHLILPEEIKAHIGFLEGEPRVFNFEQICGFIDSVGLIDLDEVVRTRSYRSLPIRPHSNRAAP